MICAETLTMFTTFTAGSFDATQSLRNRIKNGIARLLQQ
jgi:hypothetical protein